MIHEFLFQDFLGTPVWFWLSFIGIVIALLTFDLGVLHKDDHEIGVAESLKLSAFYIAVAIAFGAWVWVERGAESGMLYYTGFVIEKTLAMDNIFVIAMIFSFFGIPRLYQHRVLFWGILGVIVLRGIMIGVGAALVSQFSWILYIFAVFLIITGVKMLLISGDGGHSADFSNNPVLKLFKRHFRTTDKLHGHDFFVKEHDPKTGKLVTYMTPLFIALMMIEFADVIFAVDSVPAIFAITTDTFIIYTSNIFAILGLRALYFALAAMMARFAYLKYALSILLIFIGSKIFIADFLMDGAKFPPLVSLGVTFGILATGMIFSLWKTRDLPPPTDKQ
jgi:tellurite resistance protein TerC